MSKKIGFVGVGRMGANMARRLKECGYKVTAVYDVNRKGAAEVAAEIGAEACTKLARVTELSDVIITVVTDDKAQLAIFTGKKDSLLIGAKGRTFINCATLSPKTHVQVEKLAKKAGAASLEACMASSINQALAGTLYLMCGGEKAVFDKLKPLLIKLSDEGKLLRYIGKAGQAAQVKALEDQIEKQKLANKQIEDQIATLKERLRADVCTAKDPAGKSPPASTPVPPGQKT